MAERTIPVPTSFAISKEVESLEVQTLGHHIGNPDWVHVDADGHEHRFDGDALPTLEEFKVGEGWCMDCRDYHEETELRCRECGERVVPAWRWSGPVAGRFPGLTSFTLTVTFPFLAPVEVPVTEEHYEALRTAEDEDAQLRLAGAIAAERLGW